MAEITFHGDTIHTSGNLPETGSQAPSFELTDPELQDLSLDEFGNNNKVLNIFPSLDTGVCANSVRAFDNRVSDSSDVILLNVSADLPFAHGRFIEENGIENAIHLSSFRSNFPDNYGLRIVDGPMRGLCSRAVVVLNGNNEVIYTQQVPEIGQEPDYDKALSRVQ
jgi:thiol peroxidase